MVATAAENEGKGENKAIERLNGVIDVDVISAHVPMEPMPTGAILIPATVQQDDSNDTCRCCIYFILGILMLWLLVVGIAIVVVPLYRGVDSGTSKGPERLLLKASMTLKTLINGMLTVNINNTSEETTTTVTTTTTTTPLTESTIASILIQNLTSLTNSQTLSNNDETKKTKFEFSPKIEDIIPIDFDSIMNSIKSHIGPLSDEFTDGVRGGLDKLSGLMDKFDVVTPNEIDKSNQNSPNGILSPSQAQP